MTQPVPEIPDKHGGGHTPSATPAPSNGFTRVSAAWVATGAGLLLLIFILQNLQRVRIHYLGLRGPIPLGVALFGASVAGGVVVAIAGVKGRPTSMGQAQHMNSITWSFVSF